MLQTVGFTKDRMPDEAPRLDLQRAQGSLRVGIGAGSAHGGEAGARILALRQEGCLKLRIPRAEMAGRLDAVLVNISGGVAGGDRLAVSAEVGPGAAATLATQGAERIYRARATDEASLVETRLVIGDGADLAWLPQETILFDGARLTRRLDVSMAAEGRFLGVESLVFGRAAHGETLGTGRLHETLSISRGGRLVLRDAVRLEGDLGAVLARKAVAGGARAMAMVLLATPDEEVVQRRRLDALRAVLDAEGVEAGASLRNAVLVARILAPSALRLRAVLAKTLGVLRDGAALPRVWGC